MKHSFTFLIIILVVGAVFAQPEDHPHYEKHYSSSVEVIETEELKIEVLRPHSQESHTQFNARIYNKTNDYILIKKHETIFKSDENGYGEKRPKEGTIFIEPNGDISRAFKVSGGPGYKVDELTVSFLGFSRAPAEGKPAGAGEFKMKPERNSVMMGPFAVTLKKWRYNTKEVSADFKVRYRGEALGLVNESLIKIKKEDGELLENTDAKSNPFVLAPMKTRTVNVVKKFAKGEIGKGQSVFIVMTEALSEAQATQLEVPGFSLKFDPEKSRKENK